MSLTDYLPAIIIVIVAIAVIAFVFSFVKNLIREKKGQITCPHCKAAAEKISHYPYLFLLPVSFGDHYAEPEKYLLRNMYPIRSKEQIPTGRRACKAAVFSCSRCNKQLVEITDFLQVRGEEYPKEYHTFDHDPFRPLLEAWEGMANGQ
ncbi:MAG: hypothetical protein NC314_05435 [Roseburia sp.]|nr:hypothetical protein [Roseburia sp.]MCM1242264.1 hypothetical protein [Roseburia sp.]